jgi:tetratricopeptide (TPR) repeat protein
VARLRRRKAEDYYEEAMRLLQAQYYAAALEATDKAIGIEPGHAQAHQLRGEAPTGLNRHDEALDAYRQASKLDPAITQVQYQIALELNQLGHHAEALEAADTAIGLNPDDIAPFILRGAILFDAGRYPEAITLAIMGQYDDATAAEFEAAAGTHSLSTCPASTSTSWARWTRSR